MVRQARHMVQGAQCKCLARFAKCVELCMGHTCARPPPPPRRLSLGRATANMTQPAPDPGPIHLIAGLPHPSPTLLRPPFR